MNKKKVGELEGTPIVIGKKNYANEHEYYLTMNEDNTYLKLELRVSGDKFRLVLGGGSNNYPTVTAGDVNKVWQVTPVQKGTETKIETFEIFPEKNFDLSSTVSDAQNVDKFNVGNVAVVTINGVTYKSEIQDNDGLSQVVIVTNPDDETLSNTFYITRSESSIDFDFNNRIPPQPTVASLSVEAIQETPIYDYNWAPGVKIPIPTAEDEGKILVVTKVTDESSVSTIVPEQEVPADDSTPLTDVDLKYFVPGNTVTATITVTLPDEPDVPEGGEIVAKGPKSSNSNTIVVSGTIEQNPLDPDNVGVTFNEDEDGRFYIAKFPYSKPATPPIPEGSRSINTKSSTDTEYILVTNLCNLFGGDIPDTGGVKGNSGLRGNTIPYATIKLEYGEPNYEYLLQENSGSGSGGSNILYCEGSEDHGTVTAYIDSSELENPQITTIVVSIGGKNVYNFYFYRMVGSTWLVSGFNTFDDSNEWIKEWNTVGQYPTILAYFTNK